MQFIYAPHQPEVLRTLRAGFVVVATATDVEQPALGTHAGRSHDRLHQSHPLLYRPSCFTAVPQRNEKMVGSLTINCHTTGLEKHQTSNRVETHRSPSALQPHSRALGPSVGPGHWGRRTSQNLQPMEP